LSTKDNLTREEAAARAALLFEPAYEISFDQTRGEETYGCEARITFRCREPGASTFVDFVAPSVERAKLNGRTLSAEAFDGERLYLEDLSAENELTIVATGGYERSGVGLHRFQDPVDGRVYVHSDFEPFDAHKAYPCFDQPDLKGVFRFSVRTPADSLAVSNAPQAADPEKDGDALRWTFRPTPPIATYITALVTGPFHVIRDRAGDIDLGLWCRESLAEHLAKDAQEIFEITRQGFEFYQDKFDYPYPFGKYDQVFVPDFIPGAMENPGCVTFNELYIHRSQVTDAARERRAETILHEMAHMWFGDLVTMRWWDDVWLNESFATYVSVLSLVRATRFVNGWVTFADGEKTWAYQQDQLPTTHPITADMPDTESIRLNFDGITYAKGASVLKQLVAWVGEDAFVQGLRNYFRRHEYGNTTLADFLSTLEETSGRDLGAWSHEWLQAAGVNTLRTESETGEDGAYTSFRIEQQAPDDWPTLRSHRLAVGLYDLADGRLVRRGRTELDISGLVTEVPGLPGTPVPDLVLVNDDDLTYGKIRLDARSLSTLHEHLSDLDDPLARALCWSAAWDMVRDAELPTRGYARLALRHAPRETDIGVLQRLLAQTKAAADIFGDPENRPRVLAALAMSARERLGASEPGSEQQLAWARSWIAGATLPDHVADIRGLLDRTTMFEGLQVDTDLRWLVVRCLARMGAAGEDDIDAELERDPTAQGRDQAAAARAGRPTAEAKERAWESMLAVPPPPSPTLTEIIRGFQQPSQHDLLAPYGERYLDVLAEVWEERDVQTALAFTRGAYPHVLIEESTLTATDRYLRDRSPSGPARRLLVEGRDGIRRALAARMADAAADE
jgi:aminopeptidase N